MLLLIGWALLAQQTNPLDPASPVTWVSFGVAGVVTFAFVRGWVVGGALCARLIAQADARADAAEKRAIEAEKRALEAQLGMQAAIPALDRSVTATKEMLDFLAEQRRPSGRKGTM